MQSTMPSKNSWRQFPPSTGEMAREDATVKEGEKTIPFLRRLIDMLKENQEVISFYPGVHKKNGPATAGRIVVHDRARVESEILPRYFNHASFASLRRQLNYFCFSRVGKGKQRGAIYCNNQVIELHDILRLKRRVSGSVAQLNADSKNEADSENIKETRFSPSVPHGNVTVTNQKRPLSKLYPTENFHSNILGKILPISRLRKKRRKIHNSIVPVVHLPKEVTMERNNAIKRRTDTCNLTAPISPPTTIYAYDALKDVPGKAIRKPALHLSLATNINKSQVPVQKKHATLSNPKLSHIPLSQVLPKSSSAKEADVLDGCNALLSLGYQ